MTVTWRHDRYRQPGTEPMPIRTTPRIPPHVCQRPGCGTIAQVELRWLPLSETRSYDERALDKELHQILTFTPPPTTPGSDYDDPERDPPRVTHQLARVKFCLTHGRAAYTQLTQLGIYAAHRLLEGQQ